MNLDYSVLNASVKSLYEHGAAVLERAPLGRPETGSADDLRGVERVAHDLADVLDRFRAGLRVTIDTFGAQDAAQESVLDALTYTRDPS